MKVAIVGGSPSTQMDAPFDSDWEIWVLGNQLNRYQGKRVTRIFEIHDDLSEHDAKYARWLSDFNIPMVVGDKFPIIDDHIHIFPKNEANALLDGCLSSSPAYMMALAIMEGYTEISIYGVDMAVDDHEYFRQRPGMYAWIAFAKAKEIKVNIPDPSPLFKDNYDEGRDWGQNLDYGNPPFCSGEFNKMAQTHREAINKLQNEIKQREGLINTHHGCLQVYERMTKVARAVEAGNEVKCLSDSAVIK